MIATIAWKAASGCSEPLGITNVSWSVLQEMENYPANPRPEADLPNFQKVINLTAAFYTKMQTSGSLNLPNEMTNLQAGIAKAFEQASLSPNP